MLDTIAGLCRNGLRDWVVQRVSAVILAAYFIFLMVFIVIHPQMQFAVWQNLFANPFMRIFSFLALLSLVTHSWVGIWTVLTDYISCAYVRLFLEIIMVLALICYLVWGIAILWRI